jgi:hypothetical protein
MTESIPEKKRSKGDRRAPFLFSEQSVQAGHAERVEVPVARLPTGAWVSLPVVVIHGSRPGPVVWLSAAVHGDELNGVVIVDEVVQKLPPKSIAGTVLAVPIVNAFGLIQGSRYLPDRRDLNRSFPGSKRGSLGARLAHLFSELVIAPADIGLDFHTGSGGRSNLPQVRCDLEDPRTRELAAVFGAPVTLNAVLRDGSLRSHAVKLGKPTLLCEAGEANRLDDRSIAIGVAGALRVLHSVGVLDEPQAPADPPTQFFQSTTWVRASRSGFCRLAVELGDWVEEGDAFGTIINPATGSRSPMKSKATGVIIGKATDGLVTAGDAVIHVAQTDHDGIRA